MVILFLTFTSLFFMIFWLKKNKIKAHSEWREHKKHSESKKFAHEKGVFIVNIFIVDIHQLHSLHNKIRTF